MNEKQKTATTDLPWISIENFLWFPFLALKCLKPVIRFFIVVTPKLDEYGWGLSYEVCPAPYSPPRVLMDCSWSAHGVHGLLMDCLWSAHGVHGLLMECSWSPWTAHGVLMECSWTPWTPWALHEHYDMFGKIYLVRVYFCSWLTHFFATSTWLRCYHTFKYILHSSKVIYLQSCIIHTW